MSDVQALCAAREQTVRERVYLDGATIRRQLSG